MGIKTTNYKERCLVGLALACFAGSASATFIPEVEPNDTLGTAQNVDGGFSSDFENGITDFAGNNISLSSSHVSIRATGDGTYDYYEFTVGAPMRGWFDIDDNNFDTEIALWDAAFNVLFENDDLTEVGHTGGIFASFITFDFTSPGTYYVGVAEFPDSADDGGWTSNSFPDSGDSYVLHASFGQVPEVPEVPEPSILALLGIGLAGFGLLRRRVRK